MAISRHRPIRQNHPKKQAVDISKRDFLSHLLYNCQVNHAWCHSVLFSFILLHSIFQYQLYIFWKLSIHTANFNISSMYFISFLLALWIFLFIKVDFITLFLLFYDYIKISWYNSRYLDIIQDILNEIAAIVNIFFNSFFPSSPSAVSIISQFFLQMIRSRSVYRKKG